MGPVCWWVVDGDPPRAALLASVWMGLLDLPRGSGHIPRGVLLCEGWVVYLLSRAVPCPTALTERRVECPDGPSVAALAFVPSRPYADSCIIASVTASGSEPLNLPRGSGLLADSVATVSGVCVRGCFAVALSSVCALAPTLTAMRPRALLSAGRRFSLFAPSRLL